MLKLPYELWIGARYAGLARLGRRGGRRDRFISFIAASSMAGIALGVAALIVVLSVMNGFQKEVRDRMLSVLPHIELYIPGALPDRVLAQWQEFADAARKNPEVKGGAPFVAAGGMLVRGQALRGVQVRGIDPSLEGEVSDLPKQMVSGKLSDLKPGSFGAVLGSDLADSMGVKVGDTLLMLAPQGSISRRALRRACGSSPWPGFLPLAIMSMILPWCLSMTMTRPRFFVTVARPACGCAWRICSARPKWPLS